MIDGTNLEINSKSIAEAIKLNTDLKFTDFKYNKETGEETRRTAEVYKGLIISVYSDNKIIVRGSLHKFFNNGVQNYNDFGYQDIKKCIDNFCCFFKCSYKDVDIHMIEFGVNIEAPEPPKKIIDNIICYGKYKVNTMDTPAEGIIKILTNEEVKIYNKSKQHPITKNLLRVENKARRMRHIEEIGIKTIADLIDKDKLFKLGIVLKNMWDKIILYETIDTQKLTDSEKKLYEQSNNANYWKNLNRSNRYKKLKVYNDIIDRLSIEQTKKKIAVLINDKWEELLKSGYENTTIETNQKGDENTSIIEYNSILENIPNRYDNTSIIECNRILIEETLNKQNIRVCLSCGRDISVQKKGSKFCSEKLFGKEVKQCRNKVSNPKNNRETKIKNSIEKYNSLSVPLFPPLEVYSSNINNYLYKEVGGGVKLQTFFLNNRKHREGNAPPFREV
jgi:predicted RNA-binding Zn-ribbon protein involved in translation (DUF1610 family)